MKNITLGTALLILSLAPLSAYAQTTDTVGNDCPALSVTLQLGMNDATTDGQVSELQKFLADHYSLDPTTLVSGYFGPVTQGYVIQFQEEQGISAYGIVGPLTRAAIGRTCTQASTTPPTSTNPNPGYTSSTTPSAASEDNSSTIAYVQADNATSQNSLLPGESAAVVGENLPTFSLTVNIGNYSTVGQPNANGTQVTFTVPSGIRSGTYFLNLAGQNGVLTNTISVAVGSAPTTPSTPASPTSSSITISSVNIQAPTSSTDNVHITIYGTNLEYQSQVYFGNCNTLATYVPNPESLTIQVDPTTFSTGCGGSSPINIKIKSVDGTYSNTVSGTINSPITTAPQNVITFFPDTTAITISPLSVHVGDTVQVTGRNFTSGTYVYLDNAQGLVILPSSWTPTSLDFVVPSNITPGLHRLIIGNKD